MEVWVSYLGVIMREQGAEGLACWPDSLFEGLGNIKVIENASETWK